MARPASLIKMGFFPLGDDNSKALWQLFHKSTSPFRFLDPFGGEGYAALSAKNMLNANVHYNEIDAERADKGKEVLEGSHTLAGDAYTIKMPEMSFPLVFCNPPYQSDGDEESYSGSTRFGGSRTYSSRRGDRAELKALKWSCKYVQDGGYLVWVVYAHHMSKPGAEISDAFITLAKQFSAISVYRFPGKHLETYTQIVVVARRDKNKRPATLEKVADWTSGPMQADGTRDITKSPAYRFAQLGKSPDKIRLITKGVKKHGELIKGDDTPRYKIPSDRHLRLAFRFHQETPDVKSLLALQRQFGAHLSQKTMSVIRTSPNRAKSRPIAPTSVGQLAFVIAAAGLNGLEILHNGKRALLRGTTHRVTRQVLSQIDTKGDGTVVKSVTKQNLPDAAITLLFKDGIVEDISEDETFGEFLATHAEKLLTSYKESNPPLYDLHTDPIWKRLLDNPDYRIMGNEEYRPFVTQKKSAVAIVEFLLWHKRMIFIGEMSVGKTPISIFAMIMLWEFEKIKKENPQLLQDICRRYDKNLSDLSGIKPGQIMIIQCPANLPLLWEKAVVTQWKGSEVATCTNIGEMRRFAQHAKDNPNIPHVCIITNEDAKNGEGWTGACGTGTGALDFSRVNSISDTGESNSLVVHTPRAHDPISGNLIMSIPRRRWASPVPSSPSDVVTAKIQKMYEGSEQIGYTLAIKSDEREENDSHRRWIRRTTHGELATRKALAKFNNLAPGERYYSPEYRNITSDSGHALFQMIRRYGLPDLSHTNVRTSYSQVLRHLRSRNGNHKKTFISKQFSHARMGGDVEDEWLSMSGVSPYKPASAYKGIQDSVGKLQLEIARIHMGARDCYPANPCFGDLILHTSGKFMIFKDDWVEIADRKKRKLLSTIFARIEKRKLLKTMRKIGVSDPVYSVKGSTFVPIQTKMPLAEWAARNLKGRIGLFILDEMHRMKSTTTTVGEYSRRLIYAADRSLGLTGTLYDGLASNIYSMAYAFSPDVRKQYEWTINPKSWVDDYGVTESLTEIPIEAESGKRSGTRRATERYVGKEVPGIAPSLINLLMGFSIVTNLKDLGHALPDYKETPTEVKMSPEQKEEYLRMKAISEDYLKRCMMSGDFSYTGAHYHNLLILANAAFTPIEFWHNDPKFADEPVLVGKSNPIDGIAPKEQVIIDKVNEMLADERRCIIYTVHTGKVAIDVRYEELIAEHCPGAKPFVMKASKDPKIRTVYIDSMVEQGHNILICNPMLVQEGVNLIDFSYTAFVEVDAKIGTVQQAARRTMRISQPRSDVIVEHFYYDDQYENALISRLADRAAAADALTGKSTAQSLASISKKVADHSDLADMLKNHVMRSNDDIASKMSATKYTIEDYLSSAWFVEEGEHEQTFVISKSDYQESIGEASGESSHETLQPEEVV